MENVFQAGDVVYHPTAGKGKVTGTDGRLVYIITESGEGFCATNNICSFSPWPEPNHIRPEPPVKKGWWLVHLHAEDASPLVRYVSGKSVYSSETQEWETGVVSSYKFIRYLGQDWKEETP